MDQLQLFWPTPLMLDKILHLSLLMFKCQLTNGANSGQHVAI